MFCEKCGKQNPNDAVFCEGCGARISAAPVAPPPRLPQQVVKPVAAPKPRKTAAEKKAEAAEKAEKFKTKIKNLPKKVWVLSGTGAAVLLAFFIFLGVGKSVTSPRTIAKHYFAAMRVDHNIERAFNYLLLETSDFVNKQTLASYLEGGTKDGPQVVKFVVERPAKVRKPGLINRLIRQIEGYSDYYDSYNEKDALTQRVTINYNTSNGDSSSETIQLFDTGKRSLLFWKKYAVAMDLDGIISKDVSVLVLKGSTVTVDGIALKNPQPAKEDGYYNNYGGSVEEYKISAIFNGEHKIVVQHPSFEVFEDTDELDSTNAYYSGLTLNKATRDTLFEQTKTTAQKAFPNGMGGLAFDTLGIKLTTDESNASRVKSAYESSFLNEMKKYKVLKASNFQDVSSNDELRSNRSYECKIKFTVEYVRTGYWSDTEDKGTDDFFATITYAYENGDWVVAGANFFSNY